MYAAALLHSKAILNSASQRFWGRFLRNTFSKGVLKPPEAVTPAGP
jgi:hypothetical protein